MGESTLWNDWYGKASKDAINHCHILFTINTVGAGRESTMLWETLPPPACAQGAKPWIFEQETAATHLECNFAGD
jgi:hypothetical protein